MVADGNAARHTHCHSDTVAWQTHRPLALVSWHPECGRSLREHNLPPCRLTALCATVRHAGHCGPKQGHLPTPSHALGSGSTALLRSSPAPFRPSLLRRRASFMHSRRRCGGRLPRPCRPGTPLRREQMSDASRSEGTSRGLLRTGIPPSAARRRTPLHLAPQPRS